MIDILPKISVIIATYNSEDFILDALNSVKNNAYFPIELIVTDDNSKDNTRQIVKHWFDENNNLFVECKLIESKKNTGVSGNYNRGLREATGRYIKFLDSDDIILPDFLKYTVKYLLNNITNNKCVFTRTIEFDKIDDIDCGIINDFTRNNKSDIFTKFHKMNADMQFDYIVNIAPPPIYFSSGLYSKNLINDIGYFDERIPFLQDAFLYFMIIEKNIQLPLIDIPLACYRVRKGSLQRTYNKYSFISEAKYYFICIKKYQKRSILKLINIFKNKIKLMCDNKNIFYLYCKYMNMKIKFIKR